MIGPGGGSDSEDTATSGGATIAGGAPTRGEQRGACPAADSGGSLEDLEDLGLRDAGGADRALGGRRHPLSGAGETTAVDQRVDDRGRGGPLRPDGRGPGRWTRLAVATARLAGERVLVFSHPVAGDGGEPVTQLSVVDAGDCRVLFGA